MEGVRKVLKLRKGEIERLPYKNVEPSDKRLRFAMRAAIEVSRRWPRVRDVRDLVSFHRMNDVL